MFLKFMNFTVPTEEMVTGIIRTTPTTMET